MTNEYELDVSRMGKTMELPGAVQLVRRLD